MVRASIGFLVLFLLAVAVLPVAAPPTRAADQSVTLAASNTIWHLTSATGPPNPTITVVAGDRLLLTIQNAESVDHTFTVPHFGVDDPLAASTTISVTIPTSSADIGSWQFYCAIPGHTTGSDPNRQGMVGTITVVSATPPTPPLSVDPLLISSVLLVVVVVVAVVAVAMRRRKKKA